MQEINFRDILASQSHSTGLKKLNVTHQKQM